MASIAEQRLQSRNVADIAVPAVALALGIGAVLAFYYSDTGLSGVALAAATVMLMSALAIGVQGYRRRKEENADTGEMMRAIAETLPHPIILRNVEGEVLYSNAAARTLLQGRGACGEPVNHASDQAKSSITAIKSGAAAPELSAMQRLPWRSGKGSLLGWVEMPARTGGESRQIPLPSEEDLENLVAQRTAEVRELLSHIESCREEEKKALARSLHGDLGSSLTALSMHLAILSRQVEDQPVLHARLQQMKELLSATHDTARRIQSDLRPDKLDLFGMRAAVEDLADSVSQSTGITCNLHLPDEMPACSAHVEITLYRMLEEALRNVTRHAYATQVDISFEEKGAFLTLCVRDNGVGFSLQEMPADAHGLRSLREKAAYLGGRVVAQSAPGEGACISFVLPALQQAEALPQAS